MSPVNTTSVITRGFSRANQSPSSAVCVVTASLIGSANARQFRVGVERWRRGHGPLQGRGALAPVIVRYVLFRGEGVVENVQKHQQRNATDIGADRRDEVPAGEGRRIVRIAAWHARQAEEVLREEGP